MATAEPTPGFGWIESPDPRDALYPMRAAIPAEVPLPRYKFWPVRATLNQGSTSACVGASARTRLEAAPVMLRVGEGPTWQTLYAEAQKVDQWPGQEPEMKGSSVRAAMQVLQSLGYVTEYRWAATILDVRDFILLKGPVVFGSLWYQGMMQTDTAGIIHPTGSVVGGHAYCITGYSSNTKLFRIQNSWGTGFGQKGRCWIAETDLAQLLVGGEAAAATEVIR